MRCRYLGPFSEVPESDRMATAAPDDQGCRTGNGHCPIICQRSLRHFGKFSGRYSFLSMETRKDETNKDEVVHLGLVVFVLILQAVDVFFGSWIFLSQGRATGFGRKMSPVPSQDFPLFLGMLDRLSSWIP